MTATPRSATVKEVKDFFGEKSIAKFTAEWKALTDQDRIDLKNGIGNGTFTY